MLAWLLSSTRRRVACCSAWTPCNRSYGCSLEFSRDPAGRRVRSSSAGARASASRRRSISPLRRRCTARWGWRTGWRRRRRRYGNRCEPLKRLLAHDDDGVHAHALTGLPVHVRSQAARVGQSKEAFVIREARTTDISDIRALMNSVAGFWDSSWRPDVLERALGSPDTIALVHQDGADIDGFISAHDLSFRAYLSELVVAPQAQRRGIGARLLAEIERRV